MGATTPGSRGPGCRRSDRRSLFGLPQPRKARSRSRAEIERLRGGVSHVAPRQTTAMDPQLDRVHRDPQPLRDPGVAQSFEEDQAEQLAALRRHAREAAQVASVLLGAQERDLRVARIAPGRDLGVDLLRETAPPQMLQADVTADALCIAGERSVTTKGAGAEVEVQPAE